MDIVINIEDINIGKENVIIKGWVASNISMHITSNQDVNIKRIERDDVERIMKGKEYTCGFVIVLPKRWMNKIVFSSSKETMVLDCIYPKLYLKKMMLIMRKLRIKYKRLGLIKFSKYLICKLMKKNFSENSITYKKWLKANTLSKSEYVKQQTTSFDYIPLISIIVPVYNTPEKFLEEMILSVISQSYKNWELCIAEGNSTEESVMSILNKYLRKDSRIKIKYVKANLGISGNTNEALKIATGDYIAFLDHDDLLSTNALFEIVRVLNKDKTIDFIYSDEDKIDEKSKKRFEPHFKSDFAIDTLCSYNYITHLSVVRKCLLDTIGLFDANCDGAQDYDLILRIVDANAKVYHIPKILYHWRSHQNSTSANVEAKAYVTDAGKLALKKHLERLGIQGTVKDGLFPTSYKINYDIIGTPLISIVIPNRNHKKDLSRCIESIRNKSTYMHYELIVIENNSDEDEIYEYYKELEKLKGVTVAYYEGSFNFSAINNYGRKFCKGQHILLLNNDVEVINPQWLEEMLMYSQRVEVGCVGAKLYYPNNTIQHGGVIVGVGGVAGHSHKYFQKDEYGYMGRLKIVQNLSAVTAACLMIKSSIYDEVLGLDEAFEVAFNDVDLCLRVQEKGYLNLFTPYAELYHHESLSRGEENTPEKIARFHKEINLFTEKWTLYRTDPYYNVNLTLEKEDFSIRNIK